MAGRTSESLRSPSALARRSDQREALNVLAGRLAPVVKRLLVAGLMRLPSLRSQRAAVRLLWLLWPGFRQA